MVISDKAMQGRPNPDKDIWLIEDGARGAGRLVGRITRNGARSLYFRYSDASGERVRLLIGPYDPQGNGRASFTLRQARDRAYELSALYQGGERDLRGYLEQQRLAQEAAEEALAAELRRQAEAAERAALAAQRRLTVSRLFEHWQRAELTPHTLADGTRIGRKDGGEWVKQSFERRVFPAIGDLHAEDVKRADLLAILDDCKAGGRLRTANSLFANLRQMFRFATDREIVPRNPLDGVKRASIGGKDVERDRVLSDDELRMLWTRVPAAHMHPRNSAAIWLILATAVRVGEAMGAQWQHVDLVRRTWYLPETKNQRDHTIHLSSFALEQFRNLAELRETVTSEDGKRAVPCEWVFPNTSRLGPVDIKTFGKQLSDRQRPLERRLANRTRHTTALILPGGRWTAHDLRRTAATAMARLGVSTDVIDECLNHKLQSRVARVYVRDRRIEQQARAFDALGRWLWDHFAAPSSARVIELPVRRA